MSITENKRMKFSYLLYVTIALGIALGLIWGVDGRKAKAAQANGGYLHTDGNRIVDANGNQIIITGLNWFGLETANYTPHMLWAARYTDLLDLVRNLGYNTLRLPYSNEMLEPGRVPNGIDFSMNPELVGLSGLQIMDEIIRYSGQIGLRVFLDRHRPDSASQSPLWYTPQYPEAIWIRDWVFLADRYKDNPVVIGADVHNEPNMQASWGDGNLSTDFRLAAERVGNAILAVNPNWLIIVEGVERYNGTSYWWGGNLRGVRDAPVRLNVPNRVVYSPHEYATSVFAQPWFNAPNYPNNLVTEIWGPAWSFVHEENMAPLIVGEFGSTLAPNVVAKDLPWLTTLTNYLGTRKISFTYWCLNYNSGDTGGILNPDYTVDFNKQNILAPILAPLY
jgi:endoglucanase